MSYPLQNVTIVKLASAPVKLLKVEQNSSLQCLQKLVRKPQTNKKIMASRVLPFATNTIQIASS